MSIVKKAKKHTRSAAQRGLRWVLWAPSRAKLVGGVLAVAAVVGGSALLSTAGSTNDDPAEDAASGTGMRMPSATVTMGQVEVKVDDQGRTATEVDEALSDAQIRAQRPAVSNASWQWAQAWLTRRTSPDAQWVAAMKSRTVPDALIYLRATPATAVPETTVRQVVVDDLGPGQATALVTLANGDVLDLDLVKQGPNWLVSSVQSA